MNTITIRKIKKQWPKRGRQWMNHRVETNYLVKIDEDNLTSWRRVYERFGSFQNIKPGWFVWVKGSPIQLTDEQIASLKAIQIDDAVHVVTEQVVAVVLSGRAYQVVRALDRGDLCYQNKHGWFWHQLDDDSGIDTSTIRGPFKTEDRAREDLAKEIEA